VCQYCFPVCSMITTPISFHAFLNQAQHLSALRFCLASDFSNSHFKKKIKMRRITEISLRAEFQLNLLIHDVWISFIVQEACEQLKETRRLLVMGTNSTIVLAWKLLAIQCHRVKNNPSSHTKALCRRPHRPYNTDSLELGWVSLSDVLSAALGGREEINFLLKFTLIQTSQVHF